MLAFKSFGMILLLLLGGMSFGSGCATVEEEVELPVTPAPVFLPAQGKATIQYLTGPYASLFAAESTALWEASDHGLRITCVTSSVFSDASIAYDMAGLRTVQCYLELPDGTKIPPASLQIGSELSEKGLGALRQFTRVNQLSFAPQVIGQAVVGTRLILDAHNTQFAFTWPGPAPTVIEE